MGDDEARANETTDASDQIINTPNDEPDIAALQIRRSGAYERTQIPYPRPDVLASDLDYEHGARVVPYLAVRLMKEPEWPDWKVAAVLQYLAMEKDEKALPALVRFAAENKIRVIKG
jgi:hypothetical protein